jgi:hypothetical protein
VLSSGFYISSSFSLGISSISGDKGLNIITKVAIPANATNPAQTQ